MKKILLLLLVSVFMMQDMDAQNPLKGKYRRFSVDLSFGLPVVHGDIKNKLIGYDVAARLNWNITSAISLGTEFAIGNIKGEDKSGEYFANNYMKALVGGEVYFFNLFKLHQLTSWFQPYAGLSFGAIKSDVEKSHSEFHYNDWAFAQQMTAGLKFKLTNMIDLNLTANLLYTGTDMLDNYAPKVSANNNRDALSTYKIGLTFHVGKKENPSIIWKNEETLAKVNTEEEDSLSLYTQEKLGEFEDRISSLEKLNAELNTKLETKVINAEKEVNNLQSELAEINKQVPFLDNGFENGGISVYFETASDVIPMSERSKLFDIAIDLIYKPNTNIVVTGYADKRGNEKYNLELSLKRANKVKDYLIDLGVDGSKVNTKALGETNSLLKSYEGNRRVVLTIE